MGHANSRLPYPMNRTILDMVEEQFAENHIPIREFAEIDFRNLRRKIQRRVLRYLRSSFTPEQLDVMNHSNDGLSQISSTQWETLHSIIRDSVHQFTQSHTRLRATVNFRPRDNLRFARPNGGGLQPMLKRKFLNRM
ncbi:unnamed protein product [Echinostoma caproni]|uniref:Uncharacterized protein n=1 Tax=Echinostoma caproni TaxID=27848 RepID=A0A183AAW6_9TREM|nr:unnamed protein product [Echinostoma caproni]